MRYSIHVYKSLQNNISSKKQMFLKIQRFKSKIKSYLEKQIQKDNQISLTRTSCDKAWYVHVWWNIVAKSIFLSTIKSKGRWKLKKIKNLILIQYI